MTLIISLHNSALWREVIENGQVRTVDNIESLSRKNGTQLVREPLELSQLATQLENWTQLVVCYDSIESALAERLCNGAHVNEASKAISSFYSRLLSLRKSYRKKIKLINLAQFQMIDVSGLEALRELDWGVNNNFSATRSTIYDALATRCQGSRLPKRVVEV